MKKLSFAVKANMNKPPRVHVQSADKKTTYGSFQANNCDEFDSWDKLSQEEAIELKHYMNNLVAIEHYFSTKALSEQKDFRIRLPGSFIDAIDELSKLCFEEHIDLNVYDAMISAAIGQLKIKTASLPDEKKQQALTLLNQLGLSENVKTDVSLKIQAVFSELLSIHNKSEKLHQKARTLFNKDKSIAPKTIEEIAKGELSTSKWLVACAVEILLEEKPDVVQKILADDDILFLWANPLLKNNRPIKELLHTLGSLNNSEALNSKLNSMTDFS
ncbi:Uncharacterised protein [Legionella steigerwaltii]|uniref:Uncharacterized protein n=3 Tax=Legionellaceae TaxID=444 RepID=A0A378PGP4_9GAMM|nr:MULTISPECIES: hypothetical protein [Legionellaceae]KTC88873.1 hypothetical protein Ldum_3131 [Fluoribacter dumoffii NY 23]KTD70507.1 hypothetical protein Lstg_2992 [Legionella steigerwaltii]STO91508.1 Uncharacterised protein [Fluoribacter dumoffii]STY85971.1 Uncharacterised protein [Legionella steigerwaltii]